MKKIYIIHRENWEYDALPVIRKLIEEVAKSLPSSVDEYVNGQILVTIEGIEETTS